MSFSKIKIQNGNLAFENTDGKVKEITKFAFIDKQNNLLKDYWGETFYDPKVLEELKEQYRTGREVIELVSSEQPIKPGTMAYINGKMMFYDITKSDVANFSLGEVVSIVEEGTNYVIVTTNDNSNFEKIRDGIYFLVRRENENGIPEDVPQPFRVEVVDENQKKLKLIKIDLNTLEDADSKPDVQVHDIIVQAGSWQMILSESSQIQSQSEGELSKDEIRKMLPSIQNQIQTLQAYLEAMENAGYTEDDPEYVKTQRQLEYQQALYDFYNALINCSSCDPNDESTWTSEVRNKKQALDQAKENLNIPPPSTKEVIIKTIEKIALSVMGSIDIYLTGYYEDPPSDLTSTGVPEWVSDVSITNVSTAHFRGTSVGIKGLKEDWGPNYMVIKASYNADVKCRSDISFIIDVAKVAGVEQQRGNYRYEAFSALFKVRERNFWDYDGGNVTWEYYVNMVPLTTDPDSEDYGKYRISCQIMAYKDYHNANLGARWFATLNKFRGF